MAVSGNLHQFWRITGLRRICAMSRLVRNADLFEMRQDAE
jgi:hypothetical protein